MAQNVVPQPDHFCHVTEELIRHRSNTFSQESTRSGFNVSVTMTKNKMLKQLQVLADKKKFVNYGQKFFEEDCIVTGRDLPGNATFSIQLQPLYTDIFQYNVANPICIIFYHKDPTFQFQKIKNKKFMTYAQLKHNVAKVLKNHGMKIVKWIPSHMHDRLAAAYALDGRYYEMTLTEIMNVPMPEKLEGLPRGVITQFVSQAVNRDLSGNILNPPIHTHEIRILPDQSSFQPRHYTQQLLRARHHAVCPVCAMGRRQREDA